MHIIHLKICPNSLSYFMDTVSRANIWLWRRQFSVHCGKGFSSLQEQHRSHAQKSKELPWTQLQGNGNCVKSLQGKENQFLRLEVWSQAKKLDSVQGLLSFPNPLTMLGEVCRGSRLTYGLQWIMHSLDSVLEIWDEIPIGLWGLFKSEWWAVNPLKPVKMIHMNLCKMKSDSCKG